MNPARRARRLTPRAPVPVRVHPAGLAPDAVACESLRVALNTDGEALARISTEPDVHVLANLIKIWCARGADPCANEQAGVHRKAEGGRAQGCRAAGLQGRVLHRRVPRGGDVIRVAEPWW